ncbi:MAG: hypothetical protein ACXAB9_15730 [Candidatus Thorarchaeota archaeon]|jgi:hypothetical protein
MKRKIITPEQVQEMIVQYRAGASMAKTAELVVGSSVPTVRKYLLKNGVRLRKPGRPTFKTLNRLSKNTPKVPEQVEEKVEVEETAEETTTALPSPQRVVEW